MTPRLNKIMTKCIYNERITPHRIIIIILYTPPDKRLTDRNISTNDIGSAFLQQTAQSLTSNRIVVCLAGAMVRRDLWPTRVRRQGASSHRLCNKHERRNCLLRGRGRRSSAMQIKPLHRICPGDDVVGFAVVVCIDNLDAGCYSCCNASIMSDRRTRETADGRIRQ